MEEDGPKLCGLLRIYELQVSDFLTSKSLEVFHSDTFLSYKTYKLFNPNHFFIYRGNHESENMNKMYGFEGEVKAKYSANMVDIFTEVYNWLPLCHCINDRVLVMHGGLFAKVNKMFKLVETGSKWLKFVQCCFELVRTGM